MQRKGVESRLIEVGSYEPENLSKNIQHLF